MFRQLGFSCQALRDLRRLRRKASDTARTDFEPANDFTMAHRQMRYVAKIVTDPPAVSHSVSIAASLEKTFEFLSRPINLTRWSFAGVYSVGSAEDGWWTVRTAHGPAQVCVRTHPHFGVIDFEFRLPDGRWSFPARVAGNAAACTVIVTLVPKRFFSVEMFEWHRTHINGALEALQILLEADERAFRR